MISMIQAGEKQYAAPKYCNAIVIRTNLERLLSHGCFPPAYVAVVYGRVGYNA